MRRDTGIKGTVPKEKQTGKVDVPEITQVRRAVRNLLEIVYLELHVRGAGHGEEVEHLQGFISEQVCTHGCQDPWILTALVEPPRMFTMVIALRKELRVRMSLRFTCV